MLSLFVMARRGVESLGSLVFGDIVHWLGTPGTMMVGGTVCLLAVAAFIARPAPIRQASRAFDRKDVQESRNSSSGHVP